MASSSNDASTEISCLRFFTRTLLFKWLTLNPSYR
jgi:hypothetical protein